MLRVNNKDTENTLFYCSYCYLWAGGVHRHFEFYCSYELWYIVEAMPFWSFSIFFQTSFNILLLFWSPFLNFSFIIFSFISHFQKFSLMITWYCAIHHVNLPQSLLWLWMARLCSIGFFATLCDPSFYFISKSLITVSNVNEFLTYSIKPLSRLRESGLIWCLDVNI